MKAVEITDQNFQTEVLSSNIPVLIDFWAVWCGPCKIIAPIMEELVDDYANRVKIGKLDVDSNPQVAMQYGIRSIPTILVFKDGSVVEQIVGAVPKKHITQKLDAHISVS